MLFMGKIKIFTIFLNFKFKEDPEKTKVCIHESCISQIGLMTRKELKLHQTMVHGLFKEVNESKENATDGYVDRSKIVFTTSAIQQQHNDQAIMRTRVDHTKDALQKPRQEVSMGSLWRRVQRSPSKESSDSEQSSVSRASRSSRGSCRSRRSTTHDYP